MKNIGHIYVDDGYPESADYDNNYISYDEDAPGGHEDALNTVNKQLRLPSQDLRPRRLSALPPAIREKRASHLGQSFLNALRSLSYLADKWRRFGKERTTQQGTLNMTCRHAFGW